MIRAASQGCVQMSLRFVMFCNITKRFAKRFVNVAASEHNPGLCRETESISGLVEDLYEV